MRASYRGGQVAISVSASDVFKNSNLKGLMGNYNDDLEDDLTSPNGTVLPSNSSIETVHYYFGELCELVSSRKQRSNILNI